MSKFSPMTEKDLLDAADNVIAAHRRFMDVVIRAGAEEVDAKEAVDKTSLAIAGFAVVFAPVDMAMMKVKLDVAKEQCEHNWVRIEKDNITRCAVEGCNATK